jgi:ATP-dependent Zn protease
MDDWERFRRQMAPHAQKLKKLRHHDACHEIGHAIVAWQATIVITVTKVTMDTSPAITAYTCRDDGGSVEQLWCRCAILMAGLAAERLFFYHTASEGSMMDFYSARAYAAEIEERDGFRKPPWPNVQNGTNIDLALEFGTTLGDAERIVLHTAFAKARDIIFRRCNTALQAVALLTQKRTLTGNDLEPILGSRAHLKLLQQFGPTIFDPTVKTR